jgi:pimeloyl-ACP methyl ester carboxylesterase
MASMLWWPEPFCARLAAAGRFAIRYDHRDTGRSTSYEPGHPTYTGDDLVGDAVAVLDAYGIDRAHVVGQSMGGALAQLVALEHPARVATLTAITTTRFDGGSGSDLPGPDPEYLEHAALGEDLDWSDAQAVIEFVVGEARALAGSGHPFDEAAAREFVTRDVERTINPQSLPNHALLSGGTTAHSLEELDVPFLVIHGTADPLFPHAHGVALARAVRGASLLTIEGGGHELHPADWDEIVGAIVSHTAGPG